ncbi:glycosyltransferase family 4 protein [Treponema sp. SP13]|uniref:glycosyltransferase family 4 protein n=1 Tax=Treponema sp. SP13 TaxID=2789742 RepID=UPI003D910A40
MDKNLSKKVVMVGVYAGKNAPGGMASVIKAYKLYIDGLRYVTSWKDTNKFFKLTIAIKAYFILLFTLIFDRRVKIVHFHTAEKNSFWRKAKLLRLSQRFGKRTIMHIHAATFKNFYAESTNFCKEKIKDILNRNAALIVLSESWKNWFIGIGIPESKIFVINNIIDYPKIEEKKITGDKLHLLFMGELGDRKGIFDILKGIAKHKNELKDKLEFRIGGNKNELLLTDAIRKNGLDSFVIFEGWVAGEKKINLENWADVYILPSFNEGLPIGILEAISYNNAIISSPVGGIPDIIKSGVNGLLVTPGDDEEIFNAISMLINDKELLTKFKTVNGEFIKEYYPETVIRQLSDLYNVILENKLNCSDREVEYE